MTYLTFIEGAPLMVPNLEAYWRDPAPFEAAARAGQARIDSLFASHDARVAADRERVWAMIEGENGK